MFNDPLAFPATFRQSCALAWAQAHLAAFLSVHPDSEYPERFQKFCDSYESGLYVADHLLQSLDPGDSPSGELGDADV